MTQTKLLLPDDLRARLQRTRNRRILAFLLLSAVLIAALILRPGFLADFHAVNLTFFGLFGGIGIVLVTRIWRLLARDIEGEVEAVQIKTTTETSQPGYGTISSLYTVNVPILIVRTPQGEKRKLRMPPQRVSGGTALLDCYEEGDYVVWLAGTRYPLHFKPVGSDLICAECGLKNDRERQTCAKCGAGLVRLQ